jgi:hypothetical protein
VKSSTARIVACGLAAFLFGRGALAASPGCQKLPVPIRTEWPPDFSVTESWLTIEPEGTTQGDLVLTITGKRSLSFFLVLVNYLAEDGSFLFSIPYQANVAGQENALRNVRSFSETRLNQPLRSGQSIGIIGQNLLSTSRLPASAEVVFWMARFDDELRDSLKHGPVFHTDPLLAETPGYFQLALPSLNEPIQGLIKLRINEYGRVLDVQRGLSGDTAFTLEQFQALSAQLSHWRFFPAVDGGYAVQSDLYLLVEFEPPNAPPIKPCLVELPDKKISRFARLLLEPVSHSSDRWIPYYSGIPADGKLERIVREEPERR